MTFKFISGTTSAADLQKQVEEIQRAAATPVRGAEQDFGARLKAAVKQRTNNLRAGLFASASPSPTAESFGEKIKKAVEQKSGVRRHKENVEREKTRYRKPGQRPRTRSD